MNDLFIPFEKRPLRFGRIWTVLKEIDSTNAEVFRQAKQGGVEGLVVLADHQIKGRGRDGRSWHQTQNADIAMSVLIIPSLNSSVLAALPLAAGMACAKAIESFGYQGIGLRWPNDLILNGKKLGGILCQSKTIQKRLVTAIGIGINVRSKQEDFPAELIDMAISLAMASRDVSSIPERGELALEILKNLETLYGQLEKSGFEPLIPDYQDRWIHKNKRVEIKTMNEKIIGLAVGISENGGLLLDLNEDKGIRTILTGDCTLLKNPE